MQFISRLVSKYKIYIKYIISGGTAALTNLVVLYICTDWLGIWYVISAGIAFLISLGVSFSLQKLWTFGDKSWQGAHWQFSFYFLVILGDLIFNEVAIYLLVEKVKLYYIFAQIIIEAIIAPINFIFYKFKVFKRQINVIRENEN